MERLDSDLLFRWFVGLGIDDPVWDASTFSKNRDRLLDGGVAAAFLSAVLAIPRVKWLLSQDHLSVDGTLVQAWASMKSSGPKTMAHRPRRPRAVPRAMSVSIMPGATALTRKPSGPTSRADPPVKLSIAALLAT